ncbi:hypothetical protein QZH41_000584 [Actinostola sp. cb2023]|nr:hypothetical protein QZH41_000584 [Actinostola sp. cb2023]
MTHSQTTSSGVMKSEDEDGQSPLKRRYNGTDPSSDMENGFHFKDSNCRRISKQDIKSAMTPVRTGTVSTVPQLSSLDYLGNRRPVVVCDPYPLEQNLSFALERPEAINSSNDKDFEMNSTSERKDPLGRTVVLIAIETFFAVVITIASLLGNSLVIYILHKDSRLRSISNVFIEGGGERGHAADPVWSNLYYTDYSLNSTEAPRSKAAKRGFVRILEKLLVVPPDTQLPPDSVLTRRP